MAGTKQTTGATAQAPATTPTAGYKSTIATGTGPVIGGGAKGRITTNTTEIQQPDPTYSQFVTNTVFQNLMGRNASQDEVNYYHNLFSEYAETHPILTKSSTYDTTGSTGLSPMVPVRDVTAQKTPLVESDFITNLVRQTGDAKAFTSATTYLDAMKSAMSEFSGGY
jgi:hypothetical protein